MDVVGSKGVVEELFEPEMFSMSSTHCTVCAAALSAFATACEGVVFKSL
jgi:hypothetical protein